MVRAVFSGERPTASQRTCLMVYGAKPKKLYSLKPSDKRRISLLNSDFKLMTSYAVSRYRISFHRTLSPFQMVAGSDRRIHHMINKARDCIFATSKTKKKVVLC